MNLRLPSSISALGRAPPALVPTAISWARAASATRRSFSALVIAASFSETYKRNLDRLLRKYDTARELAPQPIVQAGEYGPASVGLIERRSQHLSFGEFSSKFAKAAAAAPHLEDPVVITAEPGSHPVAVPDASVDAYCLTHNETSTGVAMPLVRPDADGLVLVDATSAAGGVRWDPRQVDVYYFSPQKCFAADGGLWLACCSPAAVERIVAGRLNKQMADDLGISIKTVEAHRANIMEKLSANTVADLLKIALGAPARV